MATNTPIPTVLLYGESDQAVTPDLLHCEPLSTRSRAHQFKIKPHRHHGLSQVFYLKQGSGKATLDGDPTTVKAPCLIVISEMCVHDFSWSEDVEGSVISIALPLLDSIEEHLGKDQLVIKSTLLMTTLQSQPELEAIIDLLFREYHRAQEDSRANALSSLVNLLAIWLERNAPNRRNEISQQNRSAQYFNRFSQLINQDFTKQRRIESYAEELGITAPYLNSICHQLVQKNALQLVHERLLLEAKRNLLYTVLSISEIAYQLGFNDPAYFTRFFKRMTGQSPKTFRNARKDDDS